MIDIQDIETARGNLRMSLEECEIDGYTSLKTVEGWMERAPEKSDKLADIINMLSGLVDREHEDWEGRLGRLLHTSFEFFKAVHRQRYEKLTVDDMAETRFEEYKIPPLEWEDHYNLAMQSMQVGNHREAMVHFDRTFETLLESNTTCQEIYRVFCNAGAGYTLGGEPTLGQKCLIWSLELNPNYTFAQKMFESFQREDILTLSGANMLIRRMEEVQESLETCDLQAARGWSRERLERELRGFGITFTEEEFGEVATEVNSSYDLARRLFIPRLEEGLKENEYVDMIAFCLWEKICPQEPAADIFGRQILEFDRDHAVVTGPETVGSFLTLVEDFVLSGKEGLLEYWASSWGYMLHSRPILICWLSHSVKLPALAPRAVSMSEAIHQKVDDPAWLLTPLFLSVETGGEWEPGMRRLCRQHPYYCSLHLYMAEHLESAGLVEEAHGEYLEAVYAVDRRAEEGASRVEWVEGPVFDDYVLALNRLDAFYAGNDVSGPRTKLIENRRGVLKKDGRSMMKGGFLDLDPALLEEALLQRANDHPAGRYRRLLGQMAIDFTTEEEVHVDENAIPLIPPQKARTGRSKTRRNAPCPCGSGKKYKKCCLGN